MINYLKTIHIQQLDWTLLWHKKLIMPKLLASLEGFVATNHYHNFLLWHEEDKAREDDQGPEYVYNAKRMIDQNNQLRNNMIEKIDEVLHAEHHQKMQLAERFHTETPGMIVDRLSILALKIYHMQEEASRLTASIEHKERCAHKLAVLKCQQTDLAQGLSNLLDQVESGKIGFRLYKQFKMYNDPTLNPQLYMKGNSIA